MIKKNDMDRFGLTANLQHRANGHVSISFNTSAYRTETKNTNSAETLYKGIQNMSPLTVLTTRKPGSCWMGHKNNLERMWETRCLITP